MRGPIEFNADPVSGVYPKVGGPRPVDPAKHPQVGALHPLTIEATRATGSGGDARHGGGFALKAPGIVIGYLSALRSRNSDLSNAVTAPMANEYENVAKKKLCRRSSVMAHEYWNWLLTSRMPCFRVRGSGSRLISSAGIRRAGGLRL